VLATDRGPLPSRARLQIQRPELVGLCGRPHKSTYADTATMPMCCADGSDWRDGTVVLRRVAGAGFGI